jgi:3D (Asp-Asp-Asp) domain-containing protein
MKLYVDGKQLDVTTPEETVGSMLKAEGITLGSDDKINIDKEAKLSKDMEIVITRVEVKTNTESIPLSFKEVVKENSSLANTKREVVQNGRDGEKQVTTKIVYEDGTEVSREVVSEKVTISPVDKIIVQGTYPLMPVSSSGEAVAYSRVFKARATAYWAVRGVGKTNTASGKKAVRDPNGYSTIAVDPSVIPYNTKLFVEGYGFAIAADTGTAIIGNTIDVFFNTYGEACKWGVKYVNVYVLK